MALRDTLVYERLFNGMPTDWHDRTAGASAGEFGIIDPSQSWTFNGDLVLGVAQAPGGKFFVGQVEGPLMDPLGFWEAEVRFPTAPGVLAGFWLMPEDYTSDDPNTPANERGTEVDIAENVGNPNIQHTLWYRDPGQLIGQFHEPPPHATTDLGLAADEPQAKSHRYGVRITTTGYTFFVDGVNKFQAWEGLTTKPVRPIFSLKVPDYLVKSLNPATLTNNRMRSSWIRKYALT